MKNREEAFERETGFQEGEFFFFGLASKMLVLGHCVIRGPLSSVLN